MKRQGKEKVFGGKSKYLAFEKKLQREQRKYVSWGRIRTKQLSAK